MNLVKGTLVLFSPNRKAQYWPLGPPVRRFVGSNKAPALVEGRPCIEFSDGRYATNNAAIAAGMVEDSGNFDRPWGYKVDDACIPKDIRQIWNEVATETKSALLLKLIEGATETEALDSVDIVTQKEEVPVGDGKPVDVGAELVCPVQNCGKTLPAGANMSLMTKHLAQAHPDWTGNV